MPLSDSRTGVLVGKRTDAMAKRQNIILITADAWRADFADTFDGRPLLPALDAVAGRTVRFDNYYANAPWTTPALISVFGGRTVDRHRTFYQWSAPPADTQGLAALFAAEGYHAPNLSYLNKLPNYENIGYGKDESPEDADESRLLSAIGATPEPFFLWFHYKWTHLPYWASAQHRAALGLVDSEIPQILRDSVGTGFVVPRHEWTLDAEAHREWTRRMYAAQVLQLNDWLSCVLASIDARGVADHTTLLLTSDHAEELLEHGHVGHASTAHHAVMYEELLRIPLFVVDPRITEAGRIGVRAQGHDMYPTVLSLAGLGTPAGTEGFDFSHAILDASARASSVPVDDRLFYFHAARKGSPTPREEAHQYIEAISDGRFKYVAEHYDKPRTFGFDLEVDPAELSPVESGLGEWAERLREFKER